MQLAVLKGYAIKLDFAIAQAQNRLRSWQRSIKDVGFTRVSWFISTNLPFLRDLLWDGLLVRQPLSMGGKESQLLLPTALSNEKKALQPTMGLIRNRPFRSPLHSFVDIHHMKTLKKSYEWIGQTHGGRRWTNRTRLIDSIRAGRCIVV